MSVSITERLNHLAQEITKTDDLLHQVCIYETAKIDIDDFKTKLPADCKKAISIIMTTGSQAKLFLAAQESKRASKEEDFDDAPIGLKGELIVVENNLTNRTIRFASNNSGQIIAGASSVALGILGALHLGAPYPVRVGSFAGAIAFLGAKLVLNRNPDIDPKEEPKTSSAEKEEVSESESSGLEKDSSSSSSSSSVRVRKDDYFPEDEHLAQLLQDERYAQSLQDETDYSEASSSSMLENDYLSEDERLAQLLQDEEKKASESSSSSSMPEIPEDLLNDDTLLAIALVESKDDALLAAAIKASQAEGKENARFD